MQEGVFSSFPRGFCGVRNLEWDGMGWNLWDGEITEIFFGKDPYSSYFLIHLAARLP